MGKCDTRCTNSGTFNEESDKYTNNGTCNGENVIGAKIMGLVMGNLMMDLIMGNVVMGTDEMG